MNKFQNQKIFGALFFIISSLLFLSGCDNFKKKNSNIALKALQVDPSAKKIELSPRTQSINWIGGNNFVNDRKNHFLSKNLSDFNYLKISNFDVSAPPVIIDNQLIILNDSAEVRSYALNSMELIWSSKLESKSSEHDFVGGGIVYQGNKLYITYGGRNLVVLDSVNGNELFRKQLPDIVKSPPLLSNNLVLVTTASNKLYCINYDSGVIEWEYSVSLDTMIHNSLVTPTIYKDLVFVWDSSDSLIELDVTNGFVLEQIKVDDLNIPSILPSSLISQPILHGKNLYLAHSNNKLFNIDLRTGAVVWSKTIYDINNFSLVHNTLFLTTRSGQVAAVSGQDGKTAWVTDLNSLGLKDKAKSLLTPFVVNDQVVVIGKAYIYLLSSVDGKIVATLSIEKNPKYFAVTKNLYLLYHNKLGISK